MAKKEKNPQDNLDTSSSYLLRKNAGVSDWVFSIIIWVLLFAVVAVVVYPLICCLHGLFFGVLYAPGEALLTGLDFNGMLAWIASGLVFDITHAIGNFAAGLLVVPLSELLLRLKRIYLS